MHLVNPNEPMRLDPEDGTGKIYGLRVPRVVDRPKFRHAVRREGGRIHGPARQLDEIAKAIAELLPEGDPDRQRHEAMITKWREMTDDERVKAVDVQDHLDSLSEMLEQHWQPLADMQADNTAYFGIAGVVAARMFLIEWEGFDVPLMRRLNEVSETSLALIPENHLQMIAIKISQMMMVSSAEKNASPSSSTTETTPTPSSGTKTPRQKSH